MIERIRKKFIFLAVAALALAMLLVVAIVNIANAINVRTQIAEVSSFILNQENDRMRRGSKFDGMRIDGTNQGQEQNLPGALQEQTPAFSPEDPLQTGIDFDMRGKEIRIHHDLMEMRYFSFFSFQDNVELEQNTLLSEQYTEEELKSLAEAILLKTKPSGFYKGFYYSTVQLEEGGKRGLALNCETRLDSIRSLVYISLLAYIGGLLLASVLVFFSSQRAIRPFAQNIRQQKQFITDAGHELKTPLTAISANMDVLTLEIGENEWIEGTQKQVGILRSLVKELVYLSRLDEEDSRLEFTRVDLSRLVREAGETYQMMEEATGKKLLLEIDDGLLIQGNESSLQRLVSELCTNAQKYSPAEDTIQLTLKEARNKIRLQVSNTVSQAMTEDTLRHLFDRFYRGDESRSKGEKTSFGIGLAMVKAIVEKHNGTIDVRMKDNTRIVFTCVFRPLNGKDFQSV